MLKEMNASVMHLVYLIDIEHKDGQIQRFAVGDEPIVLPEGTYGAKPWWNVSALSFHSTLDPDLCSIDGPVTDPHLAEQYLQCALKIYLWGGGQKTLLRMGTVTSMKREDSRITLEIKGLTSFFDHGLGHVYSPTCRASLGDTECGVDVSAFTRDGSVTEKLSKHDPTLYFKDSSRSQSTCVLKSAKMLWTKGKNKGQTSSAKNYDDKTKIFTLWAPLKYAAAKGDTYTLTLGCDKALSTCVSVFKNALNFRGEPFVPASSKLRTRVKI